MAANRRPPRPRKLRGRPGPRIWACARARFIGEGGKTEGLRPPGNTIKWEQACPGRGSSQAHGGAGFGKWRRRAGRRRHAAAGRGGALPAALRAAGPRCRPRQISLTPIFYGSLLPPPVVAMHYTNRY